MNGDGVEDVFVSAPYALADHVYQGKAYLWFGNSTSTSDVLAGDIAQNTNSSGFQIVGERGADLNRGGFADPINKTTSAIEFERSVRTRDGDLAGFSIDSVRDFNGDGLSDLLLSALNHSDRNDGRIYIVFGKDDGTEVRLGDIVSESNAEGLIINAGSLPTLVLSPGHRKGRVLRDAGDFNGDGLSDLIFNSGFFSSPSNVIIFGKEDVQNIDLDETISIDDGVGVSSTGGIFFDGNFTINPDKQILFDFEVTDSPGKGHRQSH